MRFHGPGRDEKAMGDFGIAESSLDEPQNLSLPGCDAESGQVWWDGCCRTFGHLGADVSQVIANPLLERPFARRAARASAWRSCFSV
jgi:hypothetical protein